MNINDLNTYAENTWCPGCGNFGLIFAFKKAVTELINSKKMKKEDIVIVTGIGCHGKMFDYLDLNGFYSLHGRAIPTAEGIKLANKKLNIIVFVGDGDVYGEGLAHLIFSAKRNADITIIVHNNQNYGLTTGQFTPVSYWGYKSKSQPEGIFELPLNPIRLLLDTNASFIARGFSGDIPHLTELFKETILHKGFAFLEVLQPEVTWFKSLKFYKEHSYKIDKKHKEDNLEKAYKLTNKYDYLNIKETKYALGVFYNVKRKIWSDLENTKNNKKKVVEILKENNI